MSNKKSKKSSRSDFAVKHPLVVQEIDHVTPWLLVALLAIVGVFVVFLQIS